MSSVVLSGDTSGAITLSAPAVAGTNTITLPAQTGTILVNGPAFSVYQSSGTSLTGGAWTKILFDTEIFDTNNCFASSKFTPTVAGYYQINSNIQYNDGSNYSANIRIYKNGSFINNGTYISLSGLGYPSVTASTVVYCNGSTDYIELYGNIGTTTTTASSLGGTMFSGAMVRGA